MILRNEPLPYCSLPFLTSHHRTKPNICVYNQTLVSNNLGIEPFISTLDILRHISLPYITIPRHTLRQHAELYLASHYLNITLTLDIFRFEPSVSTNCYSIRSLFLIPYLILTLPSPDLSALNCASPHITAYHNAGP